MCLQLQFIHVAEMKPSSKRTIDKLLKWTLFLSLGPFGCCKPTEGCGICIVVYEF